VSTAPRRDRHVLLSMLDQVGGVGAAVDSALPAVVFALVYAVSGRSLTTAVWAAVGVGVALLAFRLVRREQTRNAVGGFLAVALAAGLALVTGRASAYYLVSLLRSAFLMIGYTVSIVVRYPVIGLLVGAARGRPTAFRNDPHQLRAYSRATWIWVALFALRLGIRTPLQVTGQVGWLAFTDVAMGWPLFAATILATYLYLRRALNPEHWADVSSAIQARSSGSRAGPAASSTGPDAMSAPAAREDPSLAGPSPAGPSPATDRNETP